jgi:hypothetical protein
MKVLRPTISKSIVYLAVIAMGLIAACSKNSNSVIPQVKYTGTLYKRENGTISEHYTEITFNNGNYVYLEYPNREWLPLINYTVIPDSGRYENMDNTAINFAPLKPLAPYPAHLSGTYQSQYLKDSLILTRTVGTTASYQYRLKLN